ncbi:hypothetical protein HU200_054946 [Digitaria exilis]|uniref:Uncharacterized protein n=1 Tax=Digitaria exilis TaxID=1010633 RepID=A0A835ANW2_9POAL|nr:hypothetical protein HU200_054946 [Digitaria exilis]
MRPCLPGAPREDNEEVVAAMREMVNKDMVSNSKDTQNVVSNSFLLDDDLSQSARRLDGPIGAASVVVAPCTKFIPAKDYRVASWGAARAGVAYVVRRVAVSSGTSYLLHRVSSDSWVRKKDAKRSAMGLEITPPLASSSVSTLSGHARGGAGRVDDIERRRRSRGRYRASDSSTHAACTPSLLPQALARQVKDVAEFETERDELIKAHEEKKMKLKKEYMEKEVELEKELDAELTSLMEKHKPETFQASST